MTTTRSFRAKVAGIMIQLRDRADAGTLDCCWYQPPGSTWAWLNKQDPKAYPLDRYAMPEKTKQDLGKEVTP